MNSDAVKNPLETAKQDLRLLVLEFRSVPLSLVEGLDPKLCSIVISQFALWLLDQSSDLLRTDENRLVHAEIRKIHIEKIKSESVDLERWNLLRAESLAASRLWPPEWLCAPCLPYGSPIARATATIALAKIRKQRENGEPSSLSEYREIQAGVLRGFLTRHWK